MNRVETFEALHQSHSDPWAFDTSWYELRKREITVATLSRRRYARGFEPGCSIGSLSERLAERCDSFLAADVSETALARARKRLNRHDHAAVVSLDVPREWPDGMFDLIVISEIAYFLRPGELDALVVTSTGSLEPEGDLVLVNWRGPIVDFYGLDATIVHDRFRASPSLRRVALHEEPEFLIEAFRR